MDKFKHLDTAESARKMLVDNFPGTTTTGWRWKSSDEKDGVSIRVFEGPMQLSAAVIYNPYAEEEKFALFVDTSGNYDINEIDSSKFQNKEMTEEESVKKLFGHEIEKMEEMKKQLKEDKKTKTKKPRLTKKEKEEVDRITKEVMTDHNLGILNTQIILKKESEKYKDDIIEKLDSLGVMNVLGEYSQKILHGSEEFAAINSKPQEIITTLAIECLAEDANTIRMALGEYIAAIYRKV